MHISRQSFINEWLKTLPRRDEYAPNRRSRSKFRGFEVRAQFNEKQTLNLVSPPEIDWHNLAEPHVPEVMELSIFFFTHQLVISARGATFLAFYVQLNTLLQFVFHNNNTVAKTLLCNKRTLERKVKGKHWYRHEQVVLWLITSIATLTLVFQSHRSFPYRAIAITRP